MCDDMRPKLYKYALEDTVQDKLGNTEMILRIFSENKGEAKKGRSRRRLTEPTMHYSRRYLGMNSIKISAYR